MDFDGDRRTDILSGSFTGELFLFRRNKDGRFAEAQLLEYGGGKPIELGYNGTALAYDWDAGVVCVGVVPAKRDPKGGLDHHSFCYEEWDGKTPPTSYCGSVGGGMTVQLSVDDYERLKAAGDLDPKKKYYVSISWTNTHKVMAYDFYNKTMPLLLALGPPEDTRIVFWFDN